jgi:hypothetical protein
MTAIDWQKNNAKQLKKMTRALDKAYFASAEWA